MVKITKDLMEIAYNESKNAYKNNMNKNSVKIGVKNMVSAGWNETSAKWTFPIFYALMKGEVYKRRMSISQTNYFLEKIFEDDSTLKKEKALESVKKHLDYYNDEGHKISGIRELYDKFMAKLKK